MNQILNAYINLTKPRITLLFVITGLTALLIEGSMMHAPLKLALVLFGIALVGGSANALNQYWDRDIDSQMERTAKKRPLPQGIITPNGALLFGLLGSVIGCVTLYFVGGGLSAFWGVFTIFYYVVIYTMWLKRRTPYNIVIGGAAGATAPLIAWAAATGQVSVIAVILFSIIFIWTPPHFWALALVVKDEYKKVSVPMLPVVAGEKRTRQEILAYTFLLVPLTLWPALTKEAGNAYLVAAAILGAGFIYFALKLFKMRDSKSAGRLFGYSIVYLLLLFIAMGVSAFYTPQARAEEIPRELKDIGIEEKLNSPIDPKLTFKNENGETVTLGQYFNQGRPVALLLVYYGCPSLCGYFLNGATDSFKKLDWTPGEKYEIVTISFDPRETPTLAKEKKANLMKVYGRGDVAASHWHFLTGDEKNIAAVTGQVGFKYRYDKETEQYAHVSAITVLTPEGHVSRYLYGIEFKIFDLKMALNEAAKGKVGSIVDKLLLFCYHFDPVTKKYALYAMNVMRWGGAATVLAIGGFLWFGIRRGRRAEKLVNT